MSKTPPPPKDKKRLRPEFVGPASNIETIVDYASQGALNIDQIKNIATLIVMSHEIKFRPQVLTPDELYE